MRRFYIAISRNVISLAGTAIGTISVILIVTLFALELVGFEGGPYLGILAFLILPGLLVLGLGLIPLGAWVQRRRAARSIGSEQTFPIIDLNHNRTRRLFIAFLFASVVNVIILAVATYKGVEVMESTAFCGSTCHSVMSPEFTTYQRSPHARVNCVECHIGPGANWFVKSKLSGAWQVVAVALDLYPRPIPTPVHNLRPARETCEQCHWPNRFVGDRLKVITHFAPDEGNTELKTVLLLHVGGQQGRNSHGIHWHVDPGIQVRYRSDESREKIYDVELTLSDGTVKTYRLEGEEPAEETGWREMDCVDCHNRPSHIYRMPEEEIDMALEEERIDPALPHIRREGLRALQVDYASHEEARRRIADQLGAFYAESYPDLAGSAQEQINHAARELAQIYSTNVFPSMKIIWGTYPNHIGHQHSTGCFRCHDDEHATSLGEVISQDCFTCHNLLAMEEENPEVLAQLQP